MASPPETIGNYKVVRELGRGAMGVVYLCTHPSLGRQVAVKVLPPHIAQDSEFLERFRREGEMAARLRHPNIVQVYDFACDSGQYFIVMEYLGSQTLKVGTTWPLTEVCRLMDQLLSALEHAHEHGVVHRDLKPSNILITEKNQLALTDFGIAQSAANQRLTQTGMALGTPEYMAPEQFDGKADPRSDLYAVGIIFYELVTGFTPFRADTLTEVMKNQVLKTPEPLSEVDFTIPNSVSAVVSKALSKKAEQRYQSAGEMREALRLALSQPQTTIPVAESRPDPVPGLESRPERSKRRGSWRGLPVAALVLLGVAWAGHKASQRRELQPPPQPTPIPERIVLSDSPTAEAPSPQATATPRPELTVSETPEASEPSATPVAESLVPEEGMIQPGVGVDSVLLGDSEAEVESKWGAPAYRLDEEKSIIWGLTRPGQEEQSFSLEFDKGSGKLISVTIYLPNFSVQDFPDLAIGAGVTLDTVRKQLPDPSAEMPAALDYNQRGIYFYFANRGMRTLPRYGDHDLEFIRIYEPGHSTESKAE